MRRKRDENGDYFTKPKPRPKKKSEAEVTRSIKWALTYIGLEGFHGPFMKHWAGMGSRKGVSDIIGTLPPYGRAVYIEIKRPGKEATDDQAKFLRIMKRNGAVVGVAHSVGELRDILLNAGFKPAHKLEGWK